MTITDLLALFGDRFAGRSWLTLRCLLAVLFGVPPEDPGLVLRLLGRTVLPSERPAEAWIQAGRRAGKSILAALSAIYLAIQPYTLMAGEVGTVVIIASDRKQGRVILRYILGLMKSVPALAALIAAETMESVTLTTGIAIEIHTASFRGVRGYTVVACLADEVAFWRNDESGANPDSEILGAIRPAMATIPSALLLCIGSPYARRGEQWNSYREHYGKDGDQVLFFKGATHDFNPSVPAAIIEKAYRDDPSAAAAEWGGEFRSDVESFISREALDAVVVPGRLELPRLPSVSYRAFLDFAGGSGGDSATLAIGHTETRDGIRINVLDCLRERRPPFSPESVCSEFAEVLKAYGLTDAISDRWGGLFPIEQMSKLGVRVTPSAKAKSDLYRELLPLINSRRIELLDHPRLLAQLAGLERRTARGGRDTIDHGPNAHDDVGNSAAGVLAEVEPACKIRIRNFGLPDKATEDGDAAPAPTTLRDEIRQSQRVARWRDGLYD